MADVSALPGVGAGETVSPPRPARGADEACGLLVLVSLLDELGIDEDVRSIRRR